VNALKALGDLDSSAEVARLTPELSRLRASWESAIGQELPFKQRIC